MAIVSSYIPLGERNIWSDVQPIPQNDGPNPLVQIMYAEEYKDAMDYFRAISAAEEYSERVLELTETIMRQNPAHYTVWGYRLKTLLALDKDLNEELQFLNEFAKFFRKGYQVWHHRLLLLTHISPQDISGEIEYVHDALIPDTKNYHVWSYFHWLYSHFSALGRVSSKQWEDEERWCEEMLRTDGRNNSAWGWRWYLKVARPGASQSPEHQKEEIQYALKAIHKIPHNVSAWNYLRGLLKHYQSPYTPLLPAIVPYTERLDIATESGSSDFVGPAEPLPSDTPLPISHALEFLADALVEQGKTDEAADIFGELGDKHDRMRAAYWDYRKRACV